MTKKAMFLRSKTLRTTGAFGLALASALDQSGLSSIIIDPADPDERRDAKFDGRTSAVSSSSMRMLRAIGVTEHLAKPGHPIRAIQASDGLAPGGLTQGKKAPFAGGPRSSKWSAGPMASVRRLATTAG